MPFKWKTSSVADLEKQHKQKGTELLQGNEENSADSLLLPSILGLSPEQVLLFKLDVHGERKPTQTAFTWPSFAEEMSCSVGSCHGVLILENRGLISSMFRLRKKVPLAASCFWYVQAAHRDHTSATALSKDHISVGLWASQVVLYSQRVHAVGTRRFSRKNGRSTTSSPG